MPPQPRKPARRLGWLGCAALQISVVAYLCWRLLRGESHTTSLLFPTLPSPFPSPIFPASNSSTQPSPATSTAAVPSPTPSPVPSPPVPSPAPLYKSVERVVVGVIAPFFGEHKDRNMTRETGCSLEGTTIDCMYKITQPGSAVAQSADGLFYHIPSFGGSARKENPNQLLIAMSMESSEYYGSLKDKNFMKQFDLEMTYRTCSHSILHYFYFDHDKVNTTFLSKPMPSDQKKTALVYINSNCAALSGRSQIMRDVMALNDSTVPVHSLGRCDRNMPVSGNFNKIQQMRGYKFCVAMENSITKDYITEKLWQSFEAGCVPVYMGPKNIDEFIPDPDAIIDYHKFGSPEKLVAELKRLANDPAAYEAKLAWKYKPFEQLSPVFLNTLRGLGWFDNVHTWCKICQIIVQHRYKPQKFTTCLFNSSWMEGQKRHTSRKLVNYQSLAPQFINDSVWNQ